MLSFKIFTFCLLISVSAVAQQKQSAEMGKSRLEFWLDSNGKPIYTLSWNGRPVILESGLGMKLKEDSTLNTGFELLATENKSVDENWQTVWGEKKTIRNHYKQLTVHLHQKSSPGVYLDLVFRVFEEGMGFRYSFPKQKALSYFIVTEEQTQFHLAGDHRTFWIPGDYDSNEYPYTVSPISGIDNKEVVEKSTEIAVRDAPDRYAVQTPLMMKTSDGLYINIHEAALVNYPAMQLHADKSSLTLTSALVPDAYGNKAYLHAPFSSPWRTIIVSDKAADILDSKLILNLNEPSKTSNTSWIKPMKFVGIWWEMQTGKSGWNYSDFADSVNSKGQLIPNGRHGANNTNVKRHIDFAAKNGIKGVLVEGWNVGWEDWFGKWKEDVFDFVTPYPDYDVKMLTQYAKSKGVELIMHNETSGSATNYERRLDTAFRFMNKYGYHSVKTGYVGRIIPRGEHHDGQWMVNHYERVAQKALQYKVTIDVHEPMRPTGLQRTYPNWLASEAARGNEFNAFSIGNAPSHETILPFTRLMGGPMDYTPGIFKIKGYSTIPDRQVHTTLAKQLALYVTIYSPVQMAADLIENYEEHPDAFQFIRDVAIDWDDTKILEAEPGEFVTIARKARDSESWFAGAITNENGRTARLVLGFLPKGKKYKATIYADAADADWKSNPMAYRITTQTVTAETELSIQLAPGGGAAVSFVPIK